MSKKGYSPQPLMKPKAGAQQAPQGTKADRALQNVYELRQALGEQFNMINQRFGKIESSIAALLTMKLKEGEETIIREFDVMEAGGRYDHLMGDCWYDTVDSALVRVQPFISEFDVQPLEGKEGKYVAMNDKETLSFEVEAADENEAWRKVHIECMEIMKKRQEEWRAKKAKEAEEAQADKVPAEEKPAEK